MFAAIETSPYGRNVLEPDVNNSQRKKSVIEGAVILILRILALILKYVTSIIIIISSLIIFDWYISHYVASGWSE